MRMKTIAVRQLVSRGMQALVMELVGYGSNDNRWRLEVMEEWMVCYSNRRGTIIPAHASRKQQEKKQESVLTILPRILGPWCSFLEVCISAKALKGKTGSKEIYHGGWRISRNWGLLEIGGSFRNGGITTLCPLCNSN